MAVEAKDMAKKNYYHLFANGDDAKNFITNEHEFKTAFNRFAICCHLTGVVVLSFSVEDSHPHALLWGTYDDCAKFKDLYESLSRRCISRQRGSLDGVNLHLEIYPIEDESYLLNVSSYTIIQATKDGKDVMPYDYRYGTGALYFRTKYTVLPWLIDDEGRLCEPRKFGDLSQSEKRELLGSHYELPADWLVCNGFVLPTNFVDVKGFERIFGTPNRFRVFLASPKSRDEQVRFKMSEVRGISFKDLEARDLCRQACKELFGKETTRHLDTSQRLALAQHLRTKYRITFRQLDALVHIPESELRKYIK